MTENTGKKRILSFLQDDEPTDPNIQLPPRMDLSQASVNPGNTLGAGNTPPLAQMPELGILDLFIKDPEITEIMINDTRNIMIEKAGKLGYSGQTIRNIDELNRIVRSILDSTHRVVNYDQPYLDTSLPDGSRVNIVVPPLVTNGACITIRKFPSKRFTVDELLRQGMMDKRISYFLNVCVLGKLNLLVSGGTGSGKTTLLNALTSFIPTHERIITIEDTLELAIPHANSVKLLTKPQSPTHPAISARELVANSLRMRPDRVIIGECRKAEAFDMLQAMNTGHDGSMTTIHANSPRDALSRLETLCLLAGTELPLIAIRKQITSALDLIIQIKRLRDGRRIIHAISEVTGIEGDTITLLDLYKFDFDRSCFQSTGMVPSFTIRLAEMGLVFPKNFFK